MTTHLPAGEADVALRAAVGKTQRQAEVAAEASERYNAEADEELRAAGGTPDAGAEAVQRRLDELARRRRH